MTYRSNNALRKPEMTEALTRNTIALGVVLAAWCSTVSAQASAPADPSLDEISQAWARRQAIARTIRVAYRIHHTRHAWHSEKTEETERATTVTLDGDRLSHVYDLMGPTRPEGMATHRHEVVTDTEYQAYIDRRTRPSVPDATTALITINKRADFVPGLPDVHPLVLALRPASTKLSSIDVSQLRIAPKRGVIGGRACLILESTINAPPESHRTYWIEPSRDCIIVRSEAFWKGTLGRRIDIDYDHDPLLGWVPRAWSVVDLDDDGQTLQGTFQSSVGDLKFNVPIPATEFTIEQPDGAQLNDQDGTTRWIGSEAPNASAQGSRRWHLLIIANLVAVAALGAWAIARRYRQSKVD